MVGGLTHALLSALDFKVLAVQRTPAGRWWNFRHVISPFSRLWLILAGRAVVRHHGREFVLKPGQMHLVPPFTEHDCRCPRGFDHYHLHFVARQQTGVDLLSMLDFEFQLPAPADTLRLLERLEALCPDRKLPCFDPSRDEYRRQPIVAEQADREMNAADWFEARGLLIVLLTPHLRTARLHPGVHARVSQQFLAVQEFLQANLHKPLRLADLARAANLHPTYFSDRFRELVGIRPLEYLTQRRLERAQYLLVTSAASVKEIAAQVGFPDAAYFTRTFTRGCGRSPSEYRAAHAA
ncbi:MAG: AraC family transcriptional regulator [Verrucomicrobia bacterium]|jgi:AraC-like DNA-binding protein|nr:AraC family transcriptional regulator [Verrucomicrobiota bacterium]